MTERLRTVCDFTRYAMTEMESHHVSLGHGSEDLWQEATFLVLRSLGLPFDRLQAFWNATLTQDECDTLLERIHLRCVDRLPVPYLVNEAWLTGYSFYVDERVLIPRSYIAELLEEGLSPWIDNVEDVESVLDLCTGSGCLAILAAETFPNASVTGADISAQALEVAHINVDEYGLTEVLDLVESDLFSGLKNRRFDLIISNPPYVTDEAMQLLPDEYRVEPELALAAGADGMSVVQKMIPELRSHLTENGQAVIEIGNGKEAFEALYPELTVTWLTTSGGDDQVFLVTARNLLAAGF